MKVKFLMYRLFVLLSTIAITPTLKASGLDQSVQLWVTVQTDPAAITLHWLGYTSVTGYQIQRKLEGATDWGNPVAYPDAATYLWTDNNVLPNTIYEYRVVRSTLQFGDGYGYACTGIAIAEEDDRGTIVLLVDNTMVGPLAAELAQLNEDLVGDGWTVVQHDVDRDAPPPQVKALIVADYLAAPQQVKAVYLLGHIPVPYSGNISPDEHPEHIGCWPADGYYGDMDGIWTDESVTVFNAVLRNQNVPGDGRFDQSNFPSSVELMVGRVDLFGLSAYAQSETQLLANYLQKAHDWKVKAFTAELRGLVDDNFTDIAEGFSQNAYRGYSTLVGPWNITDTDYLTSMAGGSYLWSYGCGGGTWESSEGIGTSNDFAATPLQGIFTMLLGSFFGDFDSPNNLMRSALASGTMLACGWAGHPNWYVQHMGMGRSIGYSARLTMNNAGLYSPTNQFPSQVHIALMGDPTLRMTIVAPPLNMACAQDNNISASLSWAASLDPVSGYLVYRFNALSNQWERRTPTAITATTYTDDITGLSGTVRYMVRAVQRITNLSGDYFELSQGVFCELVPSEQPDCLGVLGGSALPGTPCDDSDPNTLVDVWGADCLCNGQVTDCDGVVDGTAYLDVCGTCVGGTTGLEPNGDSDTDGLVDCEDNCPSTINPGQSDFDGDGVGNYCDNCPWLGNADQADSDQNGEGNVCDNAIGIGEFAGSPNVHVMPNPTSGEVRITLLSGQAVDALLIDALGRNFIKSVNGGTVDLSDMEAGAYWMALRDAEGLLLARARVVKE
jgi:Thrombospondin type 3 repeat